MPLRDFNPKLSDESREAISAAFDAIAECHNEVAASNEKVVTKIAQGGPAMISVAEGGHEAARRTPSRRDPCRRCGWLLAADGGGRGRDARAPHGAFPRSGRSEN